MSTRGGNWTWGLYRIEVDSGKVEPFVAPDWTEKNFPRQNVAGARVWTSTDLNGLERLIEQRRGANRFVEGTGTGARWADYDRDGRSIIYTRVARRVEYWIIDTPSKAPSTASNATAVAALTPSLPTACAYFASPRTFKRR